MNTLKSDWTEVTITQAMIDPFGATEVASSGTMYYRKLGKTIEAYILINTQFTGSMVVCLVDLSTWFTTKVTGGNRQGPSTKITPLPFEFVKWQINTNSSVMGFYPVDGSGSFPAGTYVFTAEVVLNIV